MAIGRGVVEQAIGEKLNGEPLDTEQPKVQIRNVPEVLHRRLKSRAALGGLSLSDFLLKEIKQLAERPTLRQLAERLASRTPIHYRAV
jgi:antitoxin FitA